MPRIQPVHPPYDAATEERLSAMMPPGVPPILLFRTFANNLPMSAAMSAWGGYELSRHLSLSRRDREIVIDRTCALCHCEYEWGVHVAFFAERADLDEAQITSLTRGGPDDACWTSERDRLLISVADGLHRGADIDDQLYPRVADTFSAAEILDLVMLCGWYHAVSFAANAARVDLEDGAPRFASYGDDRRL